MNRPAIPFARTVASLRTQVDAWRGGGETVALVPTMGSLHAGHLSLVDLAGRHADRIIVSIFVNPAQFGASEDLGTYPRNESADVRKLSEYKVDLIYAPSVGEMYPDGFATSISVAGISEGLCGSSRPHFFGGVATVVAKLFLQCRPDTAIFGEKDYQQLLVIRHMVRDLDLSVDVIGGPIVREDDGLAMSSRNDYLSAADRRIAPLLNRIMLETADRLAEGTDSSKIIETARVTLTNAGFRLDYLELRDADTLDPLERLDRAPARLFAAVHLGKTRLIDNVVVPGARPSGT